MIFLRDKFWKYICWKYWERRDSKPLAWRIHDLFITHESCSFVDRRGWIIILPLWYFKLYYTRNNMYKISKKYWGTRVRSQKNSLTNVGLAKRCSSSLKRKNASISATWIHVCWAWGVHPEPVLGSMLRWACSHPSMSSAHAPGQAWAYNTMSEPISLGP
jgi:hypothetical protein